MVIKWINRFSNESGYIKYIDYKNKHFVNTFNGTDAKKFVSTESAEKAINKLIEYGEAENNIFEIINI